jgi:LysR family transcriptional regulator, glycine cleavage system transcriptional activator
MADLNRFHLNGLRALEVVYRNGTLSRAAVEMGISTGAVSQHVIKAEHQLGFPVFHRTASGLTATALGDRLLKCLEQGFREIARGVEPSTDAERATIHISCTPVHASKWLVPRLPGFLAKNPGVQVQVISSLDVVELDRSSIDIAIRTGKGPWPGTKSELLVEQRIFPVCSPALAKRLKQPRDLLSVPIIRNQNALEQWGAWLSIHGLTEDQLGLGPTFSDYSLCIDAATAGLGVMLGTQIITRDSVEAGNLAKPFKQDVTTGYGLWFVTSIAHENDRKILMFKRWLKRSIKEDFGAAARP